MDKDMAHETTSIDSQREKSLELINLDLTHKMKNMLMIVQTSLTNLEEYLPQLIQTYQIAMAQHLNVGNIYPKSLTMLHSILLSTKQETQRTKFMLDLFNFMVHEDLWKEEGKTKIEIRQVWQAALAQYPWLSAEQKARIDMEIKDFMVWGSAKLLEKVFFILLNNIYQRVNDDQLWCLQVETRSEPHGNYFCLQDNGNILATKVLPHLFERVYYLEQQPQLGCFPCWKILQLMDGEITCFVTERNTTMFQLRFPVI